MEKGARRDGSDGGSDEVGQQERGCCYRCLPKPRYQLAEDLEVPSLDDRVLACEGVLADMCAQARVYARQQSAGRSHEKEL